MDGPSLVKDFSIGEQVSVGGAQPCCSYSEAAHEADGEAGVLYQACTQSVMAAWSLQRNSSSCHCYNEFLRLTDFSLFSVIVRFSSDWTDGKK